MPPLLYGWYHMRMRSIGLGLWLLNVGCAPPSRSAPPPPANVHEAVHPTSSPDGIIVRLDAPGLRVSYVSLQPAQTFRFNDVGAEIRKETWKVLGAGLSLVDNGVAATTPVSSFDVRIAPDSKQRDRVYPALTRVGEGWMIYAPHLRIEGAAIPGRLSIEVPSGWTVVGRRDAKGKLVGDGYVFAGPSEYVHRGAADVALNRHLERCQAELGNRDLRTHGPKGGGATYACGTVLQWAIDIGLRKIISWPFIAAGTEASSRSLIM